MGSTASFSLSPAFGSQEAVTVVLAVDENYIIYVATAVQSILDNAVTSRAYDIVLLHEGIPEELCTPLLQMAALRPNISIRLINISAVFARFPLKTQVYFTRAIYYRLGIPSLFRAYPRVVYIDADTVCRRDIADLYDTDLGGNSLGAVVDFGMARLAKARLLWCEGFEKFTGSDYIRTYLDLPDDGSYFQSGVLVFDLETMRAEEKTLLLAKTREFRPYAFPDQDILNVVFASRVKLLDPRWNVTVGWGLPETWNVDAYINWIPDPLKALYLEARKDPWLVHYAGAVKPASSPLIDFSGLFWDVARRTPFYTWFIIEQTKDVPKDVETAIRGGENRPLVRQLAAWLFPRETGRGRLVRRMLL